LNAKLLKNLKYRSNKKKSSSILDNRLCCFSIFQIKLMEGCFELDTY
ncbi:unnamed protein product, partial [Tenebrio molitor]